MAGRSSDAVVKHLQTLFHSGTAAGLTDGQLLEQFVNPGDASAEAAFAALVERHGPMVLNVCRQVLGDPHDAEDASQTAFLILAHKAGSIRKTESVASWLFGVACRVSARAKADAARRRAYERRGAEMVTRLVGDKERAGPWPELYEELERLPQKYRAPLVLCYLEGLTHEAAAGHLHWTLRTVRSRLVRGRERLRGRLARRGVTLSATLMASALTSGRASSAMSAAWAERTVRSAIRIASGETASVVASVNVTLWTEGVLKRMFLTKLMTAAASILVIGATASTVWLTAEMAADGVRRGPVPAQGASPAPRTVRSSPAPARKAEELDARETITLDGRVLGKDGRPFAGATVSLSTDPPTQGPPVRTRSGPDGAFRLAVSRSDAEQRGILVATAPGLAPDWAEIGRDAGAPTLRLAQDHVAIHGRILDLQGQPLQGVTIQPTEVQEEPQRDLTPWLKSPFGVPMRVVDARSLGLARPATTDTEGKFQLGGFGDERVVEFHVRGPTMANTVVYVIIRPVQQPNLPDGGQVRICNAVFDLVVPPCKPIRGTVRERGTGRPIANARVGFFGTIGSSTTSGPDGRYTITGIPKAAQYGYEAEGMPYFKVKKFGAVENGAVGDTPGLEPLTADIELERGVAVRGRLLDRVTGRPMRGHLEYICYATNPHAAEFTSLGSQKFQGRNTADDGTFEIVAAPGPGMIGVCADQDRFVSAHSYPQPPNDLPRPGGVEPGHIPPHFPPSEFHTMVAINPSPGDPKSSTLDIVLEPGRAVEVKAVDPQGKPLAGVHAAGRTALRRGHEGYNDRRVVGESFTVLGLDPQRPRSLVLLHPEKALGTVLPIRGDESSPLTVRLEPLGALAGRIVDDAGQPLVRLRVRAMPENKADAAPLPLELIMGWGNPGTITSRFGGEATTDADGRFRIGGLVPGLGLKLYLGTVDSSNAYRFGDNPVVLEPGESRDLGEIRADRSLLK
jgi:RNA polymerase sigma factor (sigma-70 family)